MRKISLEIISGERYGHLVLTGVIISRDEHLKNKTNGRIECKCDCGNIVYRKPSSIVQSGNVICSITCTYHPCYKKKLPLRKINQSKLDLIKEGTRFGHLITTNNYIPSNNYGVAGKVECKCDCGKTYHAEIAPLLEGRIKCCSYKCIYSPRIKHNLSLRDGKRSKEYNAWYNMKSRCDDIDNIFYNRKGITYSEELSTIESFMEHIGEAPSKYHQFERIDKEGDYELNNVQWKLRQRKIKEI